MPITNALLCFRSKSNDLLWKKNTEVSPSSCMPGSTCKSSCCQHEAVYFLLWRGAIWSCETNAEVLPIFWQESTTNTHLYSPGHPHSCSESSTCKFCYLSSKASFRCSYGLICITDNILLGVCTCHESGYGRWLPVTYNIGFENIGWICLSMGLGHIHAYWWLC